MESLDYSDTHIDLRDIDVSLNIECLTLPLHNEKYTQPSEAAPQTSSPGCALDSAHPPQQTLVAAENQLVMNIQMPYSVHFVFSTYKHSVFNS